MNAHHKGAIMNWVILKTHYHNRTTNTIALRYVVSNYNTVHKSFRSRVLAKLYIELYSSGRLDRMRG